MAYPRIQKTSPGVFKKTWNYFTGGSSQNQMQESKILDQPSMQEEAMRIYLEEYKKILCDFSFSSLNPEIATSDILHIFHSLRYVHSCTCVRSYNNATISEYKNVSKVRFQG